MTTTACFAAETTTRGNRIHPALVWIVLPHQPHVCALAETTLAGQFFVVRLALHQSHIANLDGEGRTVVQAIDAWGMQLGQIIVGGETAVLDEYMRLSNMHKHHLAGCIRVQGAHQEDAFAQRFPLALQETPMLMVQAWDVHRSLPLRPLPDVSHGEMIRSQTSDEPI